MRETGAARARGSILPLVAVEMLLSLEVALVAKVVQTAVQRSSSPTEGASCAVSLPSIVRSCCTGPLRHGRGKGEPAAWKGLLRPF